MNVAGDPLHGRALLFDGARDHGRDLRDTIDRRINLLAVGHRFLRRRLDAGNLLADEHVLDEMISGFQERGELTLTDRLLAGLKAAAEAGGEAGPLRSAGLLVSADVPWPVVDLRIDDHGAPVTALRALWELYAPLRDDYVTRALNPSDAPAFGVPGDE